LAVAVGVAYFLAARLSLLLMTQPGVAVFWPAAGVSSGTLIALGRTARWPVAIGVIAATITANLMGDRNVLSASIFTLSDAGEPLLVAWMFHRYTGSEFRCGRLHQVLGLLAAAIVGAAVSGVGGVLGYKLGYNPQDPTWTVWRQWVASDVIGIVAVAPLIVGFVAALRAPPSRRELIEGAVALIAVATTTGIIIFMLPADWWEMTVTVVLLFPVVLWVAARCRPAVASAAVFIVSLIVMATVTFKLGNYGNTAPSIDDSIMSAQITIVGTALCAFILSALFAEQRQREADLVASEARLRMAQASTGVGIWDLDLRSHEASWTPELEEIYGLEAESVKAYSDFRDRVHPHDIENLEARRDAAIRKRERFLLEFRIIRPGGEVRWVSSTGSASYDQITGEPTRVLGNNVDITERKRAEEHQKTLMAELDHRVKNVLARVAMLAASTRKGSTSIEEYVRSLNGRIQSMALAHSLLSQSGWQNVGLGAVVRGQLAPYATGSNVTITGEDIALGAAETHALALVLHELVTNAAKYGALSNPDGRVSVGWGCKPNGDAAVSLVLVWRECGGPPVAANVPPGYGTSLIRDLIPHELGGTVDLVFAPDGVNCKIDIPIVH